MSWSAPLALVAVLFGFSGILGDLIYRARSRRNYLGGALLFGSLVVLPTCLAVPEDPWLRTLVWGSVLALIATFSLRPARLPDSLWSSRFAYAYLAGVMATILIWGIGSQLTPSTLLLSPFAGLAGALAWQRSRLSVP